MASLGYLFDEYSRGAMRPGQFSVTLADMLNVLLSDDVLELLAPFYNLYTIESLKSVPVQTRFGRFAQQHREMPITQFVQELLTAAEGATNGPIEKMSQTAWMLAGWSHAAVEDRAGAKSGDKSGSGGDRAFTESEYTETPKRHQQRMAYTPVDVEAMPGPATSTTFSLGMFNTQLQDEIRNGVASKLFVINDLLEGECPHLRIALRDAYIDAEDRGPASQRSLAYLRKIGTLGVEIPRFCAALGRAGLAVLASNIREAARR